MQIHCRRIAQQLTLTAAKLKRIKKFISNTSVLIRQVCNTDLPQASEVTPYEQELTK